MHIIDILILIIYMITMLGIGFFFLGKNLGAEDYYVGGRQMGSWHIRLSVVVKVLGSDPSNFGRININTLSSGNSQTIGLRIGIIVLILASLMTIMLEFMLYSYVLLAFGLFVIGALFWEKSSNTSAFWGMLSGGVTTVSLSLFFE